MAGSTTKKVVIRRFEREALSGFVNPQTFLQPGGVELLTVGGSVFVVPYDQIKILCFVRDFDDSDPLPESRLFATRPKMEGLWVRMRFRDGELADGLLPNNLLQMEPYGFTVSPPNPTSRTQRLFVPRTALSEFQVLGVVGGQRRQRAKPKPKEQIELFER